MFFPILSLHLTIQFFFPIKVIATFYHMVLNLFLAIASLYLSIACLYFAILILYLAILTFSSKLERKNMNCEIYTQNCNNKKNLICEMNLFFILCGFHKHFFDLKICFSTVLIHYQKYALSHD